MSPEATVQVENGFLVMDAGMDLLLCLLLASGLLTRSEQA